MQVSKSVPLGDVLQRFSSASYSDLQQLLTNMKTLSPEVKYEKLKLFISKTKKQISQLLAIIRWLGVPGVLPYFVQLETLDEHMNQIENKLNQSQDELFFAHRNLYWGRVRNLEVSVAMDILGRGTYQYLPKSIFTCGQTISPDISDETILRRDLNILIRSKVALIDQLPKDISHVDISDGLLILRNPFLYELAITLTHLDHTAPWRIIGFKILVDYHENEEFQGQQRYDKSTYEQDVLNILTKLNSSSSIIKNSIENEVENMNENPPPPSLPIKKLTLSQMHNICIHSSIGVSLRSLYVLALDMTKTLWKNFGVVKFVETETQHQCVFSFWNKSKSTGIYLYELRIIQYRKPNQVGKRLIVELWSQKESQTLSLESESVNGGVELIDKKINGFTDLIIAEDYITNGCNFTKLLDQTIRICIESKLLILLTRLNSTVSIIQSKLNGLTVTFVDKSSIKLKYNDFSVININVDYRTGRFVLGIHTLSSSIVKNLDSFFVEINNIEMMEITRNIQIEIGVLPVLKGDEKNVTNIDFDKNIQKSSYLAYKPIATVDKLIYQLAISYWIDSFRKVLGVECNKELSKELFDSAGISYFRNGTESVICFNLSSWKSISCIEKHLKTFASIGVSSSLQKQNSTTHINSQDNIKKRSVSLISNDNLVNSNRYCNENYNIWKNHVSSNSDRYLYIAGIISEVDYTCTIYSFLCGNSGNDRLLSIPYVVESHQISCLSLNSFSDVMKSSSITKYDSLYVDKISNGSIGIDLAVKDALQWKSKVEFTILYPSIYCLNQSIDNCNYDNKHSLSYIVTLKENNDSNCIVLQLPDNGNDKLTVSFYKPIDLSINSFGIGQELNCIQENNQIIYVNNLNNHDEEKLNSNYVCIGKMKLLTISSQPKSDENAATSSSSSSNMITDEMNSIISSILTSFEFPINSTSNMYNNSNTIDLICEHRSVMSLYIFTILKSYNIKLSYEVIKSLSPLYKLANVLRNDIFPILRLIWLIMMARNNFCFEGSNLIKIIHLDIESEEYPFFLCSVMTLLKVDSNKDGDENNNSNMQSLNLKTCGFIKIYIENSDKDKKILIYSSNGCTLVDSIDEIKLNDIENDENKLKVFLDNIASFCKKK
jgi:hypothetical protein